MATAEEILMAEEAEDIIVIDSDLRTINIPSTIKILGVESDKDVLPLTFRMPSTYHDADMSGFEIRINYVNAKQQPDVYLVTDKTTENGWITFEWLVGRFAVQYKGDVKFIVCFRELDESGKVIRELNTTIASLPVLEGLEPGDQIIQQHPEVLEELLKKCSPVTHAWDGTTLIISSANGTSSADLQGPKGPPGTVDFVSITEPPTGVGAYAIVLEEAFTINGITFPKYAKGMFTAGSGDASMYVIDRSGAMYTAYRNNGVWDRATIVGQAGITAYQLVVNKGYEGTEDEFATKLLSLLELEKYNGETEDVEGDGDTGDDTTLITLYVDGNEYQVEAGTKWADITTYYPDDFTIDTEDSSVYWKGAQVLGELNVPVNTELTIINGTYYGVMSG